MMGFEPMITTYNYQALLKNKFHKKPWGLFGASCRGLTWGLHRHHPNILNCP